MVYGFILQAVRLTLIVVCVVAVGACVFHGGGGGFIGNVEVCVFSIGIRFFFSFFFEEIVIVVFLCCRSKSLHTKDNLLCKC